MEETIASVERCDAVIWSTPVYTMLVPWQLIRFFDLVAKAGRSGVFRAKYATSVMSCFHYYDHLAEEWLRGTCEDLGMSFVEGMTADDTDMLRPEFRASMRFFLHEFHLACVSKTPVERKSLVLSDARSLWFAPPPRGTAATGPAEKKQDLRTVLLTDEHRKDGNLSRMIEVFLDAYPNRVEVVDINEFPYEGACRGCLRCELVGECDRHDGFQSFYQNLENSCDVLVQAMNLEGRFVAPVWKLFLYRTFSNGHRTSMMGKHTATLVVDLANRLDRAARAKYQKGVNFLGLGGIKIFRDLIYGMRGSCGTTTASTGSGVSMTSRSATSANSCSTCSWGSRSCSSPCGSRRSSG
ncbi:MAG: NAD(P)H-dependent oxidoreductase [Spirochaetes bacterium]|nr:NAD(P)H-dependent oxidoreductase [Spirochaetota bacterium]